MPSTFTLNKNIEQPAHGAYPNAWDGPVNSDWAVIDNAFGGASSVNVNGVPTGTYLIPLATYQPPNITFNGTINGNLLYVLPAGVGGIWSINNNTTGGFNLLFGVSGGGSLVILQGSRTLVICDGVNMQIADSASVASSEAFATAADLTVLSNAENFATAADVVVTTNTEAYAAAQASAAQSNSQAFTLAQNYAPLASPALTGVPTAPTAAGGTSTTQLATTAFATAASNGSSLLAANGWAKFPSGLVHIWGTLVISVTGTAYTFSTLSGIAFPTSCFTVDITPITSGGLPSFAVGTISATGFILYGNSPGSYYFFATGH